MACRHHWTIEQRIAHYTTLPNRRGCRLWTSATTKRGYPKLGYKGRCLTVTRFILAKQLGRPLRPGMWACHTCDVQSCCTETHLFEGTSHDNHMDMVRKGRSLRGERHHRAKLTNREVRAIRRQLGKRTKLAIAADFGVSPATVRLIERGIIWVHI